MQQLDTYGEISLVDVLCNKNVQCIPKGLHNELINNDI